MLTGFDLGRAIELARIRKGVSKAHLAAQFEVKPPSVQTWIKFGRIDKGKLFALMEYFSDVVGPDHWGIPQSEAEKVYSTPLLSQLKEAIVEGLLNDDDLEALSAMARHLVMKNRGS